MRQYLEKQYYEDIIYFYNMYPQSTQFQSQHTVELDNKKIFEHAVYCFLTPATKSDAADKTCKDLFTDGLIYHASLEKITSILRQPPYIRFHNQKAERLIHWQEQGFGIIDTLKTLKTAKEKREFLVENVKGMNYKESTHFLRNIGQSEELVILDRHIINFMKDVQVLADSDTMSKLSRYYLKWEMLFQEFVNSSHWINTTVNLSKEIPRADFAIWAASVKRADTTISYDRVLLLK